MYSLCQFLYPPSKAQTGAPVTQQVYIPNHSRTLANVQTLQLLSTKIEGCRQPAILIFNHCPCILVLALAKPILPHTVLPTLYHLQMSIHPAPPPAYPTRQIKIHR
ncbi:hypothetical protein CEXT_467151 [Caerostris extrusa]|uniref:Uncharacterized protein n=1 Tax=Caerostris extrusa TaxID=172846 RepID=A0AAV4WCR4_CAEEX|nr:hypothetical protein CEXT_467151 [Caerostris extrusa]